MWVLGAASPRYVKLGTLEMKKAKSLPSQAPGWHSGCPCQARQLQSAAGCITLSYPEPDPDAVLKIGFRWNRVIFSSACMEMAAVFVLSGLGVARC